MALRYWVGGAGNWSSTTRWSSTSGGVSGASVPTAADDAIFDSNSGTNYTVTVDGTVVRQVNSITVTQSTFSSSVLNIVLSTGLTVNNLSVTGLGGARRVVFSTSSRGLTFPLTVNGTHSLTNCDFLDVYAVGSGVPLSGTRVGDLGGNSGIFFSAPKTVYWSVPAGGNLQDNAAWAAYPGGSGNEDNFPLGQDTAVIGDVGLNASATITVGANGNRTVGTLDLSGRTLPMVLSGSTSLTVLGDLKFSPSVTSLYTSTLLMAGRYRQTIRSAGSNFTFPINIQACGGIVTLGDAFSSNSSFQVSEGTFDTNGYSMLASSFSSNLTNVRTILLRDSTITLTSPSPINFSNTAGLVYDSGASTFVITAVAPTIVFGRLNHHNVTLASTALTTATISLSGTGGSASFNNFVIASRTLNGIGVLSFAAPNTYVINGTLTFVGEPAKRLFFKNSGVDTSSVTFYVASLNVTDCDFEYITLAGPAAGASPIRAGDCGGNSGIVFPAPKTVYWNLSGSRAWSDNAWAMYSGGPPSVNNFPLAQDVAVIDNAAPPSTITMDAIWNIGGFDASACTAGVVFDASVYSFSVYRNWTFGPGFSSTAANFVITLAGSTTQTITSNGVAFNRPLTIKTKSSSTVVQLGDALSAGIYALTVTSGVFDAVAYNVSCGSFSAPSGGLNTVRLGSATWSISNDTGSIWSVGASNIIVVGTAEIVLTSIGTGSRTFIGGNNYYPKLTIGGVTGSSTTTIQGNNSFGELASIKTVAHTIAFGSTAQTFGKWTATGSAGNVITVTGSGTIHVLYGPATSGLDYLAMGSIGFDTSLSCGEFYAGPNSTGTNATIIKTAPPAPRTLYWVGGTGTWSTSARWSLTSGGAGGQLPPTSLDDVIFNAASSASSYTVTVDVSLRRVKSLTVLKPASGSVTIAGSVPLAIHASAVFDTSGVTWTHTGVIRLSGTGGGKTLTPGAFVFSNQIIVSGVGAEWALGAALSTSNTNSITVTAGSFATNNYTMTAGRIAIDGSLPGTLSLGSSTVTLTGIAPILVTGRNSQLNAGTSGITCNSTSSSVTLTNSTGGDVVFHNVSFTGTSAFADQVISISGTNTFSTLFLSRLTSNYFKILSLQASQTINSTLQFGTTSNATFRFLVRSSDLVLSRTLYCASVTNPTDVDFIGIDLTGPAAPLSGTRLGDRKRNSGIIFDAPKTVYWGSTGSGSWSGTAVWALSVGGAVAADNLPLPQDTIVIPASYPSSAGSITLDRTYAIGTIDMSARTSNTLTFASGTVTTDILGDWITGTGVTISGTGLLSFVGGGAQNILSAGKNFTRPIVIAARFGSVTLQDSFTNTASTTAIDLQSGTFSANGYNVTLTNSLGTVRSQSSVLARVLDVGAGTWTINASGTSAWAIAGSNITVSGTGVISMASGSAKTFGGGDLDYSGITLDQGGVGTLTLGGANTFKNITASIMPSAGGDVTISPGVLQTLHQFTATGTATRRLLLLGTSAANPSRLVLLSGKVDAVDYLSIQYGVAYSRRRTWYAGANSINAGSGGWYFEAAPPPFTSKIFYGSTPVTELYYGADPVYQVYYGSTQVF